MARILAIDYGKKRVGLAVTDELQMIANGLTTIPPHEVIPYLREYTQQENVEAIVVGEPKQMDNTESESARYIKPFLKKLKAAFPDMPVKRMDERFTSKMAFQAMIDGGMKRKQRQNKAMVDKVSATIILQSYLQSIS
ncbi:MAG TPA: Holliday junction resolvase RuvX [Bacteroidales bacterium]|nr:Holliday junction resolvase RuvX [Bacteroidales bacterium]